MSVDPLAEKFPGWNPYNYTMQNPINLIDTDGRQPRNPYGWLSQQVNSRVNQVKNKVQGGVNTLKNSMSTAITNTRRYVNENKTELLINARALQDAGETIQKVGLVAAVAGTPVAGVGATPGLGVAAIGAIGSAIGDGMEIAVDFIAGDYEDGATKPGVSVVSALSGKLIDNVAPTSKISASSKSSESTKVAKEIIKSEASNTIKEVSNNKPKDK